MATGGDGRAHGHPHPLREALARGKALLAGAAQLCVPGGQTAYGVARQLYLSEVERSRTDGAERTSVARGDSGE